MTCKLLNHKSKIQSKLLTITFCGSSIQSLLHICNLMVNRFFSIEEPFYFMKVLDETKKIFNQNSN